MTEPPGFMAPVTPTFPGNRVTPAQLQSWVQAGEPVLVLDDRDRQRWAA